MCIEIDLLEADSCRVYKKEEATFWIVNGHYSIVMPNLAQDSRCRLAFWECHQRRGAKWALICVHHAKHVAAHIERGGDDTCVHDNVQSSEEIYKVQSSEETMGGGTAHIKWAGVDTCAQDNVPSSEEIDK